MKRITTVTLAGAVAALVAGCSSTPDKPIAELENARAVVPQVEASPRAGVAAAQVSSARNALDRANELTEKGGKPDEIRFEAERAVKNASIANEKILTAQAMDEIEKGKTERQAVLLVARNRQAQSLENELKELKKTDRGLVLTLSDVLFDTGKATLKPGAYATIDRVATALKQSHTRKVTIEGHADSVGSTETNQALSQRRADSVRSALLERGVAAEQVASVGRGEDVPVASNDNAAGRQQNRRVEMVFTEGSSKVASD